MESQPGEGSGAGEEPGPDPGLPGGGTSDSGLAGFVKGGVWDSAVPSAALAAALEGAAGAGGRCGRRRRWSRGRARPSSA